MTFRRGAQFFWLLLVLNFLSIRIELVELHRWRPKKSSSPPSLIPISHNANNNTISSKKLKSFYNSKTKNDNSTQHHKQDTEYISTVRKARDSDIRAHQLSYLNYL